MLENMNILYRPVISILENVNILYRPVIFDSLGGLHFRDLGKIGHFGEMERRKTNFARGGKTAQGEKPI